MTDVINATALSRSLEEEPMILMGCGGISERSLWGVEGVGVGGGLRLLPLACFEGVGLRSPGAVSMQ